jgi:rod shape-determining protein MreC
MRDFLRRIRLPLLFAGLLLVTAVFMAGDRRALRERGADPSWVRAALLELAAPVQRTIRAPWSFLASRWSRYVALVDVGRENDALRARIALLEEENLQFREALVASGHLQRIAEMRQDFEVPLLPSHVVGQDVSPWFHSVLLDRGRASQVRSGMPVVTDDGLVGLVTATSPRAARTMMLIDRRSAVDGIVQRSRARGIVRGAGTDTLEFTLMVRGDDVQPGDVVITSGVGGVYPKGLRIGTVASVQTERRRLMHTAEIRPSADFGRLEQVFVMLHRGPTMELLYEGDGAGAPEGTP